MIDERKLERLYAKCINRSKIEEKHKDKLPHKCLDDCTSSDSFELRDDDFGPFKAARELYIKSKREKKQAAMNVDDARNKRTVAIHNERFKTVGRFDRSLEHLLDNPTGANAGDYKMPHQREELETLKA
jgi:hypothetical protein